MGPSRIVKKVYDEHIWNYGEHDEFTPGPGLRKKNTFSARSNVPYP